MKMIRVLTSAVAVLSLASSAATAQGAPKVMKACAPDMQKFCSGAADRHAARQCLRSHFADVSPECHSAMEAAMEAARAARAAREAASAGAPPASGSPAGPPH